MFFFIKKNVRIKTIRLIIIEWRKTRRKQMKNDMKNNMSHEVWIYSTLRASLNVAEEERGLISKK